MLKRFKVLFVFFCSCQFTQTNTDPFELPIECFNIDVEFKVDTNLIYPYPFKYANSFQAYYSDRFTQDVWLLECEVDKIRIAYPGRLIGDTLKSGNNYIYIKRVDEKYKCLYFSVPYIESNFHLPFKSLADTTSVITNLSSVALKILKPQWESSRNEWLKKIVIDCDQKISFGHFFHVVEFR